MKVVFLEDAISRVRELAINKLTTGENADEFVEIGNADGFKIYAAAGKTIDDSQTYFHGNSRDVFMLVLEGEIELMFERGESTTVRAGQCFVLPKHLKHRCVFRKLTVAVEGVYETGL